MDGDKISNSIYISFATLEVIIILYLESISSGAYCSGLIWLLPVSLLFIPAYRIMKKHWN